MIRQCSCDLNMTPYRFLQCLVSAYYLFLGISEKSLGSYTGDQTHWIRQLPSSADISYTTYILHLIHNGER